MAGGTRGQIIDGRFELLERLGSGGMGTVWRARDLVLQREVALKEVRPPDPAMAPEGSETSRMLRERVIREAQALARLNHPHVVTIHHIIEQDPHPWLVMELLPGRTLQDLVTAGPVPAQDAARIGRDVLAALHAAHLAGIHHRDVKPGNVLLRADGSAVLTDFGIAALQGSTSLTATGDLIGSPEYIAPERIRSAPDDPAADLWSLGMMLYVAVEGHNPLRRGTSLATLAAVLDEPVPEPVRSGPLTPVLNALLVRDPAARPDAERLDAMLTEAATAPATPPPPPPAAPPYSPTQLDSPHPGPVHGAASTLPTQSAASPGRRGRNRMALVIGVLAGAVVLMGGVIGALLLASDSNGNSADGGGESPSPTPTDQVSDGSPSPSPTPEESTSEDEKAKEDGDKDGDKDEDGDRDGSESPSPDTESSSPDGPPGSEHADAWVAQLFSEPVGSGTAARDRRLAAVRKEVPEAQVLRSDDFASLRPGYWMIYAPGPFADGKAALSFCAERGRTSENTCMGRYLSTEAADRVYICSPKSGGSGRCTRS